MIADARFRIYGTNTYPDATFTLRVTYGAVEGWTEKGELVEPFTHTERLFERATGEPPFALPESWHKAREALDPSTPFNFVSTNDITGGNSGSPVLNQNLEVVGIAFDSNVEALPNEYVFRDVAGRTVSVDACGILEALDDVYDADRIALELTTGRAYETEAAADAAGEE